MNNYIISQWNKIVNNEDIIIHCGDFCMGSKDQVDEMIKQLNGIKILIKGNHDRASNTWWENHGFAEVHKKLIIDNFIFTHKPIQNLEYGMYNIHGHIHNADMSNVIWYNKKFYFNVSVDAINFAPINFNTILKEV
jgi:calcineurin-like phosphoesterase family protein